MRPLRLDRPQGSGIASLQGIFQNLVSGLLQLLYILPRASGTAGCIDACPLVQSLVLPLLGFWSLLTIMSILGDNQDNSPVHLDVQPARHSLSQALSVSVAQIFEGTPATAKTQLRLRIIFFSYQWFVFCLFL